MKLFQLHFWDDKTLILRANEMNALQYQDFHERVLGFPEQRFVIKHDGWLIPQTPKNIEYLLSAFDESEYDMDDFSTTFIEYAKKTQELQAIKVRKQWAYTFNEEAPELPCRFKTEPFKHQRIGLYGVHNSEYFGLLMEMGTGKTKIMIDEVCWVKPKKVLIVCPKTVIGTWIREFEKHATEAYFIKRLHSNWRGVEDLLEGMHAKEEIKVWITNYDRIKANLPALLKMQFDVLICDESTYIKNPRAKRTKAIIELGSTAKRRFILTGTPAGNTVMDLFSQFQFLQPGMLGYSNYNQFAYHYGKWICRGNFDKLVGYKHLDELKLRMSRCSFVVKKKDCLDLPEKVYEDRFVEMGAKQRELYEQMLEIALADIEGNLAPDSTVQATVVVVQLLRLAQICSGYLKTIDATERVIPDGNVKLEALKDIIEETDPDSKVCVWARFRYDVRQIQAMLDKMKVPWVALTGKESESVRDFNIRSFANDHGARVMIGEPGAGGMGVTLIGSPKRPCTTVVFYNNDFSMLKRVQAEDRSHRIGIRTPVTYIDIICEDTIEERIVKILQAKKDLNEMIKDFSSIKQLLLGTKESVLEVKAS